MGSVAVRLEAMRSSSSVSAECTVHVAGDDESVVGGAGGVDARMPPGRCGSRGSPECPCRVGGVREREFAQWSHGLSDGEESHDGTGTEDGGEESAAFERCGLDVQSRYRRDVGSRIALRAELAPGDRPFGADVDDEGADRGPGGPVVGDGEVELPRIPEVDVRRDR